MLKTIFFFLFLIVNLYAKNVLEIHNNFKTIDASPFISYINDQKETLKADDILKYDELLESPTKGQLKIQFGPIWSKLHLKNSSSSLENIILHNPLPGTNYIDVYIYKENKLIKSYSLGDMRAQDSKEYVNRHSLFELSLIPNEELTIISKISNFNVHNVSWTINNPQVFLEHESRTLIYLSLAGGIFLTFIVLNFVLFIINKSIVYLYISLLVLMSFLYLLSVNGFLYQLDIGISLTLITAIPWLTPNFSSFFFLGIAYYYFNVKILYKKSAYIVKALVFLNLLIILSYPLSFYFNKYFFILVNFSGVFFGVTVIFMFIIGLYMKTEGLKYYLIAQLIYLIAVIIYTVSIFGFMPYVEEYRHMMTLVGLLDIGLLMIAQIIKTKNEFHTLQQEKILLMEQSRFLSIEQVVSNIVHQWKNPLTHLGTSITLVEAFTELNHKDSLQKIKSELPKINFSIELMKNTIDEFSIGKNISIEKAPFYPLKNLHETLNILNSKITINKVNIELYIDEKLSIVGYEHIFSNIMMNFIDNSLDQFEDKPSNKIGIYIYKDTDSYIIKYTDNAGGIKVYPIENVFEYHVSTKEDKNTHGRGLAMVKMLVEDRLNGNISVKNTHDGVEFLITLNKEL